MDRKKHRIFWGCLAAAILTAIAVFFACFQITSVKVEGNKNYTEDEIKKMVLSGPLSGNSVLVRFLDPDKRTKDAEFINKVWLERTSRHSLVIHVREKELIGYVKFLDGNLYFDRNGIVQVSTTEELENIPNVEGLKLDKVGVGEKIPGLDKSSLSLILSVTKMLEKGDEKPDRLVLDEKGQLVLYYGKVEARMGSDKNMDEKMSRLLGIIPQLGGMEGVLHLENVDETSKNVVFDKVLSEAEQEALKKNKNGGTDDQDSSDEDEDGDGSANDDSSGYDNSGDEGADYSEEETDYEEGSGYDETSEYEDGSGDEDGSGYESDGSYDGSDDGSGAG